MNLYIKCFIVSLDIMSHLFLFKANSTVKFLLSIA